MSINIATKLEDFKGLGERKDGSARKGSWPVCRIHNKRCMALNKDRPFGPVVCPDCYKVDPDNAIQFGAFDIGRWRFYKERVVIDERLYRREWMIWRPWPKKPGTKIEYYESTGIPHLELKEPKAIPLEAWEIPPDCIDLPRSPGVAKAAGSKLYFKFNDETGDYFPCGQGHISPRYVSGQCKQCNDESMQASRAKGDDSSKREAVKWERQGRKLPFQVLNTSLRNLAIEQLEAGKLERERYARKKRRKKAGLSNNSGAVRKRNRENNQMLAHSVH